MDDTMNTASEDSFIGEAVSGRGGGQSEENVSDEDDIYYIPPRRPSLELESTPMDTGDWYFVEHAVSPVESYGTMTSEDESAEGEKEDGSHTGIHLERRDSFSSCYSIDSNDCEKKTLKVRSKDDASEPSDKAEMEQEPEEPLHPSYTVGFVFKTICNALKKLPADDLENFKYMLWKYHLETFKTSPKSMDIVDVVDRLLECYSLEKSLKMTKNLLTQMANKRVCDYLQTACITNEVCHDLREHLKKKYGEVDQDLTTDEKKRPFNDLYTDVYISSISNNGPNIEHEVMTIKKLNSNSKKAKQVSTENILDPQKEEGETHSSVVFLTGMAGSGKSMVFRRLIFDWIEDQSSMSILLPLTIGELKQFEDSKISFVEILSTLYPETSKIRLSHIGWENDYRLVFLVDGLDEFSEKIEFGKLEIHSDSTKPTSMKINLNGLIGGRMFFHGYYVILCRPHVKSWLAWDMMYDEKELRGFCDPEKDEYFKKRFEDPDQANRVIEYVKSCKTLHILCHLPLFSSLVADECQLIFREKGTQGELPRSITYMFTKLMLALLNHGQFRRPFCESGKESEFLMKLGQLALSMLEKGEFMMTRSDWIDSGMGTADTHHNSGLLTHFTVTVRVLYCERMVSFIHPTMQEYMAALYAYLSFRNLGKNIFDQPFKHKFKGIFKGHQITELYKAAVERSLQCEDGKLDMFLCFLCGMANKSNQELLSRFCNSSSKIADFTESVAGVIRKKISDKHDRNSSLQRCLKELGV